MLPAAAVWLRVLPLLVAAAAALVFGAPAVDAVKRPFDLPADRADKSIRRFAEQSGLEVFYPSSATRGIRTAAVKGEMTASEALAAMLAGTGLVVVGDPRSGAFSLKRESAGAPQPAQQPAAVAPASVGPPRTPRIAAVQPDPLVVLSPFEVVAEHRGYHAANTLSGTRLNAKLEDLGASISIVTREQMDDFALLDLNDLFNYEAGTEGTGNFTDFRFNRNFEPVSNADLSPHTANRIRGLGPANTAWGNFETSGRVPIDPLTVEAVEISRGPNASLFGIGSPAGTVNTVPATASLSGDRAEVATRVDDVGGHRSTVDFNRVLRPGVLALRGSAAYQHQGFDLEPSGLDTERLNGMARYRPFAKTLLTGTWASYRMHGNHPNLTLPRETISGWIAAGRPTWDPIARTVKRNGAVVGTYPDTVPPGFTAAPHDVFANFFIEPAGVSHVSAGRHTTRANPDEPAPGGSFLVNIADDPLGFRTAQPLYAHVPSAADRSLYDWSAINLAAPNRVEDKAAIANVTWDQVIVETPRHLLAFQGGWFREQVDSREHYPVGAPSNVSTVAALHVDVNERLLDGSPNPNFLRPFFGTTTPYHTFASNDRDAYRAQVAGRLDWRDEPGGWRWLGRHDITGYAEYRTIVTRQSFAYAAIVDEHPWLGGGVARAGRGRAIGGLAQPGPNIALGYFRYYVGDRTGQDVDFAPGRFTAGTYPLVFGNPAEGFQTEPVSMDLASFAGGGGYNQRTIVKSRGVVLQSHWLRDRVVGTLGIRHDRRYGRSGAEFRLQPDGVNIDHAATDAWAGGDWNAGGGSTHTAGIVVKPLGWLNLHANRSDSFQPAPVHQDLYLNPITDPTGEGTDYGFTLKLLAGKLNVKVNRYRTLSLGVRGGTVQNFANRVRNIDFVYDYSLQKKAEGWVTADAASRGETLTPHEMSVKVADIMRLPETYLPPPTHEIDAVQDIEAEGTEVEFHYNPSSFWTVKANFAHQEATARNIGPEINRWINDRLRVWQTIIDPTIGRPWFTEPYGPYLGGQSPKDYLDVFVIAPLKLAQALEGKSLPQVRKYRANLSTRFRLAALTDRPVLKRLTIGGAARWEGRGLIGYRGLQQPPEIVTAFDPGRPIMDRDHLHLDAFIGYRAPLLSGRVRTNWQFNVRDVTEGGGLQPIAADPDGTPSAYRIIPPRRFLLSVTFEF